MQSSKERRKYIRISTVLPIEFFVVDRDGRSLTPWLQGFSHDIGRGGLCLIVNDLWQGFRDKIKKKDNFISLKVNIPFARKPIYLEAKPTWSTQEQLDEFSSYTIGLEFFAKNSKEAKYLFRFALTKKAIPILVGGCLSILLIFSSFIFLKNVNLSRENKKLVNEYVRTLDKKSLVEGKLSREEERRGALSFKQEELKQSMASLEGQVLQWEKKHNELLKETNLDKKLREEVKDLENKISGLDTELKKLKEENLALKEAKKENAMVALELKQEARSLNIQTFNISSKVIDGMYDWIKNRQDLMRGLILSYEGDDNLERVCFTYDQALAAIVFILFDDYDRAEKILDFYLGRIKKDKNIYNAYFTAGNVFEYTTHSGPNAWIGIAALCYAKHTNDRKYLPIAYKVADFLLSMMDKEGGVIGGPNISWYSTEHNLDAFSFFDLLYKVTKKKRYLDTANRLKDWISRYSYTQKGPPVKRGKGDSTIATDTYAWSITAVGPDILYSLGMDPEAILDFAVKNCEVEVEFERSEGDIKLSGFDFARTKHSARGGVVSGEWSSQMILAFEILADYFLDKNSAKSDEYLKKAAFYFNELQKMLITSPSRVGRVDPCLPYASKAFVNTGHGWRTPKGNRTGSLASTAYFLIAYSGYNPLKAEYLGLSLADYYKQNRKKLKLSSLANE